MSHYKILELLMILYTIIVNASVDLALTTNR
jgi:hypothetical protein